MVIENEKQRTKDAKGHSSEDTCDNLIRLCPDSETHTVRPIPIILAAALVPPTSPHSVLRITHRLGGVSMPSKHPGIQIQNTIPPPLPPEVQARDECNFSPIGPSPQIATARRHSWKPRSTFLVQSLIQNDTVNLIGHPRHLDYCKQDESISPSPVHLARHDPS